jgi:DNA-binding NarL/FixJ family response regulator
MSDQSRSGNHDATAAVAAAPQKLRILLADDHAVVREGIKTLVNAQTDMEVIDEATDGFEALHKAGTCQPDVVIMDVSMPHLGGAGATAQLRETCPRLKILALSMHEDKSYLRQLLEAGASGYVLKRSAADDLIRAIRTIAGGGVYLDPALAGKVVGSFVRASGVGISAGSAPGPVGAGLRGEIEGSALSERETEVLGLIAQGYSNKEIAAQLSISVKTVETYKARSMEKLGLVSRAEIVRYALAQGWLQNV